MINGNNENVKPYFGLSTDEKPIKYIGNGSIFTEIDTSRRFIFSEENKKWYPFEIGGSGGTGSCKVEDVLVDSNSVVLNKIAQIQLKTLNEQSISGDGNFDLATKEQAELIDQKADSAVEQSNQIKQTVNLFVNQDKETGKTSIEIDGGEIE